MDDSNSGTWTDAFTSLISTAGGAFNSYERSQAQQQGNRPMIYGPGVAPYGNPGFGLGASSGSSGLLWVALIGLVGVFAFMQVKK